MKKKALERKKKNKEQKAKKRVLARRHVMRTERKKKEFQELVYETEYELKNGKAQPLILKKATYAEQKEEADHIKAKLEHNMKILEALEEQYLKEQQNRERANVSLEEDGNLTMKQKVNALHKQAVELAVENGEGFCGPDSQ